MSGTTAINRASRLRIFTESESDREPVTLRLVPAGTETGMAQLASGKLRCLSEQVFRSPLRRAIADARLQLTRWQEADGSFRGQRPLDPAAVVEFLLFVAWQDRRKSDDVAAATRALAEAQRPDGSWPRCHGGAADVNTTILAYLALKLWDGSAQETVMQTARRYIWNHGGLAVADAPTRMFLALFGQGTPRACRRGWFWSGYFGVSIQRSALQLLKRVAGQSTSGRPGVVRELLKAEAREKDNWRKNVLVCRLGSAGFMLVRRLLRPPGSGTIARLVHTAHRWRTRRLRAGLVRRLRAARVEKDGLERLDERAAMWAWLALSCDSAGRIRNKNFVLRRMRPRWANSAADGFGTDLHVAETADTAMAVVALARSGLTMRSAAMRSAVDCLVARPPRSIAESAWTFMALNATFSSDDHESRQLPPEVQICSHDARQQDVDRTPAGLLASAHDLQQRLKTQLLESQRSDGGWSAGRTDRRPIRWLASSQVGLTALVLQALGAAGYRVGSPGVDRAVDFLKRVQLADGRFADRVHHGSTPLVSTNAVETTANALAALIGVGVSCQAATCQAATDWLVAHQQPEGGWGELPQLDPKYIPGEGPVCVEATAAVVDSLVAAGLAGQEEVGHAVDFLLDADCPAGLQQQCRVLRALCHWAADENNKTRGARRLPVPPLRVAGGVDVPA